MMKTKEGATSVLTGDPNFGDDKKSTRGLHEDIEQYQKKDTTVSKLVKELLFSDLPGDLEFIFSLQRIIPAKRQMVDTWKITQIKLNKRYTPTHGHS